MYKRNFIFIGIYILLSSAVFAQSAEAMFRRGNEFYQAKDFNRAIKAYENLVDQGYEGTELFYNLGNAYYRVGKLGYAILYYEKAAKLSPSDEDVQHNLALANIQTVDRIETMPRFFIFQWWESLLALLSISGWSVTAYIFYFLLLVSVVVYFFAKEPAVQKYSVYSALASIVLLAFAVTILTVNINRENNVKRGIVVERIVTAKVSPDDKSNDAFVIHEGLKVSVEDRVANWLKIRLEDGKIGWLPRDDIRII